ncbi:MAG TPA: MgtC/SapB family protein [Vicinamibacterales bacterium]|nr:MgtC/SapB family protein [Vicinamibacterales bacterium]
MHSRLWPRLMLFLLLALAGAAPSAAQPPAGGDTAQAQARSLLEGAAPDLRSELKAAMLRLPLAALLGAMLAVRPRRKGTPARQPAVIQTQIILAIVGAAVMLVVGSNLARAFGVVGAAGLVRYRAKVEDNKDAGVMLSALAAGLASGVGQYAMAVFTAAFIMVTLWVIESFEPEGRKLFDLKIKMGKDTDARRKEYDAILNRFHVDFDLLSSSDEEVCYEVWVPLEMQKDRLSNALLRLDPEGHGGVEWTEKKPKKK